MHSQDPGRGVCQGVLCEEGKFSDIIAVAPVTCADCAPGMFQITKGMPSCDGTACPAGKYGPPGNKAMIDATCTDCLLQSSDSFQDETGQTGCKTCPGGKFGNTQRTACAVLAAAHDIKFEASLPYSDTKGFDAKAQKAYKEAMAQSINQTATDNAGDIFKDIGAKSAKYSTPVADDIALSSIRLAPVRRRLASGVVS